jgi:DNA helicase-2/ATP-dependent DNA helicase PcrA
MDCARANAEETLSLARAIALSEFHRFMKDRGGIETRPPRRLEPQCSTKTGYRKMLMEEGTEESASRMANLDELLSAAADAAERGETLRDFWITRAGFDAGSVDDRAPVSL